MANFDLTTTEGLLGAVAAFEEVARRDDPPPIESTHSYHPSAPERPTAGQPLGSFTGTYCQRCGDYRRMNLVAADDRCARLNPRKIEQTRRTLAELETERDHVAFSIGVPPPVFTAICTQCEVGIALVVEAGPPTEVIVLGSAARGFATAHTPPSIAFYLDQAYRSRSRGAFTAAVGMYRSALELLLGDQGFTQSRLIDRIDAAIAEAPGWAVQLDDDLMNALRRLGNRAMHPDPEAAPEEGPDRALVHDIEHVFLAALHEIYEVPAKREALRERIRGARETN